METVVCCGFFCNRKRQLRAKVTEYLYNREHNGRVVINDEIKAAIDKYYEEYGCK